MEETDTKPGTLKLFQRGIGKLFLVAAGMGAVVLVIFVVVPMLLEPAPEPTMQAEEIVAEVLGEPEAGEEAVDGAPAPPVPEADLPVEAGALAAIYPAEEETTFEAGLPPVLSPEEIEAALSDPAPADSPPAEPASAPDATADEQEPLAEPAMVAQASAETRPVGDAARLPEPPSQAPWQPELTVVEDTGGGRLVEMTLPPPSATREVQELLESLGYEPGPVDGVWGDRTARAWKRFARDAADLEARVEPAQASFVPRQARDRSGQTFTADAPPHPEGSAPPSGGNRVLAAPGAGQVDPPPPGLPSRPLEPEGGRTRVPGTLRGVMGYRLPLVSRQEVPDQIVSGVLIPAHTTFVILRGGEWELVGLSPDEVRRLKGAAEAAAAPPETEPPPVRRSWNPLRLFRRQAPHQDSK